MYVKKVEGDIAYAIESGNIRSNGRRHDKTEMPVTDLTNAGFADGDDSDRDGDHEGGHYLEED